MQSSSKWMTGTFNCSLNVNIDSSLAWSHTITAGAISKPVQRDIWKDAMQSP